MIEKRRESNVKSRLSLKLSPDMSVDSAELSFITPADTLVLARRPPGLRLTPKQAVRAKYAFLQDYVQWANISSACVTAGVTRDTYYRWREHDAKFDAACNLASEAATERLEREAWRRATEGSPYRRTSYWHGEPVGTDEKVEYSDNLMMLLLRARRPDLYREKVDMSVTSIIKTVAGVDPSTVL